MKIRLRSISLLLCLFVSVSTWAQTKAPAAPKLALPEKLPITEFVRLMREFSEESGDFHSDNLISNEASNLQIADKLKELHAPGGAYIGVGPEQNFTFIAKTRPRIAFIVDLRRLAAVQHLMYKALFQMSPTRGEFFSHWLSVPLIKGKAPANNADLNALLQYFTTNTADEKLYADNLATIRQMIEKEFQFTLTPQENESLEYVLGNFKKEGLGISYQLKNGYRNMFFPTLRDIISQTDLHGKQGNFLASDDDYNYVRNLHLKNLIIPVTGNFAGTKALPAVADYLRKYNLTVATMYTSNVEQYLFQYGVFEGFAKNVQKLPIDERSLFIRTISSRVRHPARSIGNMFTTLMQRMPLFLSDYSKGEYTTYDKLTMTNYIAAEQNK